MNVIYADHAATTPLELKAMEAMQQAWQDYANPAALYRAGLHTKQTVEKARMAMAECLGCSPNQLFFTSGGSEGNTWAVFSMAQQERTGSREVVTTPIEHHSVLGACDAQRRFGIASSRLPVDGFGRVDAAALERAAARRPRLVSIQCANNEVGTIQDIPALAKICHAQGVPLHVDAVQAAGHLALPIKDVDLLTASAHKFGGPKGIGFLYAKNPGCLRPLIYGGTQQHGLRPGTEPAPLIAGMAAAFQVTCAEREERAQRKRALAQEFCDTLLAAWPQARLHSTPDGLPGIVSVGLPGFGGQQLTYELDIAGVCVSPGAACDNTGEQQPSHVLLALGGIAEQDALSTLRFSFGSANHPGDGREAAERLLNILKKY